MTNPLLNPPPQSLPDYITARLTTPFTWGTHDCITFAIGWLSIRSGRDLLAPYGKWHDELGARRAIKKAGGIEAQFDAHLTRIPPSHARDGDIALVGNTVFIFTGTRLVGPGPDGLLFKRRGDATCAWSL